VILVRVERLEPGVAVFDALPGVAGASQSNEVSKFRMGVGISDKSGLGRDFLGDEERVTRSVAGAAVGLRAIPLWLLGFNFLFAAPVLAMDFDFGGMVLGSGSSAW
jgi:hypothetical protein